MLEKLRGRKPTLIDFEQYRHYAVVIPLIEKNGTYEVLFEVRSSKLNRQPGEICFPGGRCDAGETPEEGALREICEELLVEENQVEMIAPMDILISPSSMILYPYLGILKEYKWTFSTSEVREVFTVPLRYFLETDAQTYYNTVQNVPQDDFPFDKIEGGENYKWHKGKYPVHFYEYNGYVIWGLTARIMRSVAQLMNKSEHQLG
jgi:8-oxo-dGTP pyrophosphatase MutT (NUDIX family)